VDTASAEFIIFGLTVAAFSNLSRSVIWRQFVVILGSVIFIAVQCPSLLYAMPLLMFVLTGFVTLKSIEHLSVKTRFISLGLTTMMFLWMKKYAVLPSVTFMNFPYLTLGMSYVFFRILHLQIEQQRAGSGITISFGRYIAYVLNFTTFVSGPIQHYEEFARDQFAGSPMPLSGAIVAAQFERIILGLFKVDVVALIFNMIHTDAMSELQHGAAGLPKYIAACRLVISYPLFLYSNFSGYIDIVIALARLLRLQLPENFDRPFSSASFLEFWSRWHVTLSSWLKTYVYNPLFMSLARRTSSVTAQQYLGVLCFFVTFFLVGIWHGRTSEFLAFGLLQGGGVAMNKLWQIWLTGALGRKGYKRLAENRWYVVFARGLTFTWFSFTLFWFWADWSEIANAARSINAMMWPAVWLSVWALSAVVLACWQSIRNAAIAVLTSRAESVLPYARVSYATALAMLTFVVVALLGQAAPDIVYKAF
jgi:alginate O-acetyltransferase complex protein AlgI